MTAGAVAANRPTIDQWRTLAVFAPTQARRWEKELLWCEDCHEWHAPAARGLTRGATNVSSSDSSPSERSAQ